MISEIFLDKVLDLYFCKTVDSYYDETIVRNDIMTVLAYASNNELPIRILPKFELVNYIIHDVDWDKNSSDIVLENISSSDKFSQFIDLLKYKQTILLDRVRCQSILQMINMKKEGIIIEEDKNILVDFLDKYESGDFSGSEELVKTYEDMISNIYIRTLLKKRYDDTINMNEFVFENELSLDNCLKIIEKTNDETTKIKSGLPMFDRTTLRGGFDNGRIYIFGGTPGVGKSIMLLNLLCGATFHPDNEEGLYFYFTLENFIEESLDRMMKIIPYHDPTFGKSGNGDPREVIKGLEKSNKKILMKYLHPYTSTVNDAMIYIDEAMAKTGLKPKMIIFDYLDLFSSVNKTDLYRLELGYVTMEQKMVGIKYSAPVITATQLNAEGYNKNTPGLGSLTESKKKVEHGDFVGLLKTDDSVSPIKDLFVHVRKNRNGPLGDIAFKIDYVKMIISEQNKNNFSNSSIPNIGIDTSDIIINQGGFGD